MVWKLQFEEFDGLETVVEVDTSQATHELAARFGVSMPSALNTLKHICLNEEAGQIGTTRTERASNDTSS